MGGKTLLFENIRLKIKCKKLNMTNDCLVKQIEGYKKIIVNLVNENNFLKDQVYGENFKNKER
jgi:hypothetical protein